jgi:hypothetical protein
VFFFFFFFTGRKKSFIAVLPIEIEIDNTVN